MLLLLAIPALSAFASPPPRGVDAEVAIALEQQPEIRAAFARWESAVHQVARSRTLPEPTLQFAVFVQSVETRVGPQQARISLKQAFPWPTKLTAGAEAASLEAQAAQRRFEAVALGVTQRVERAHWTLWEIRTTRALHQEHLEIVRGLATTVRSRVEIGAATLADLQQIELSNARLADRIASLDEERIRAEATLVAAMGSGDLVDEPIDEAPRPEQVAEEEQALRSAAESHPRLEGLGFSAEAADASVKAAAASRLPSFSLRADWIVTGPAAMPGTADSGKDAVVAGVGMRVPLWQGAYRHDVLAKEHEATARRHDRRSLSDQSLAELRRTLAEVRDSGRRMVVVSGTLLPQAEAAYDSVLGSYASGQSAVAQTLLSQRDLLDLGLALTRASADHQRAWARLEQICGREVERTPLAAKGAP